MARYPANHKAKTRRRILGAAGRVFRSQGYSAGGIGDVMGAAELTKGGFYSHFRSKEQLFDQSLAQMFVGQRRRLRAVLGDLRGVARIEKAIAVYLDPHHLDAADSACPLTCLVSELRRANKRSRLIMEAFFEELTEHFETHLLIDRADPTRAASIARGLVTLAIGAATTARACERRDRAECILADARETAGHLLRCVCEN